MMVPAQREPWATIHTKRPTAIEQTLTGPKGRFALGRITDLAAEREYLTGPEKDVVKLRFRSAEELAKGGLVEFLTEHLANISNGSAAQ
jgi:hypothetical protein